MSLKPHFSPGLTVLLGQHELPASLPTRMLWDPVSAGFGGQQAGFAAFSSGWICSTPNTSTPKTSPFPGRGEERDPFPLGSLLGQMGWVTLQQLLTFREAWAGAQPLEHEMREN